MISPASKLHGQSTATHLIELFVMTGKARATGEVQDDINDSEKSWSQASDIPDASLAC